jgi:hypothetical protein
VDYNTIVQGIMCSFCHTRTHTQERGTILTAFIVCYALTSGVGGYISGSLYARQEGRHWIRAMLATGALFPGTASSSSNCFVYHHCQYLHHHTHQSYHPVCLPCA